MLISRSFIEWEIFQTKFVEKIKTHILCSVLFFFQNWCNLWDNVKNYGRARQARDDSIARGWITVATYTYILLFCGNNCFMNVPQCIMFSIITGHTDVLIHLCTRLKIPSPYIAGSYIQNHTWTVIFHFVGFVECAKVEKIHHCAWGICWK